MDRLVLQIRIMRSRLERGQHLGGGRIGMSGGKRARTRRETRASAQAPACEGLSSFARSEQLYRCAGLRVGQGEFELLGQRDSSGVLFRVRETPSASSPILTSTAPRALVALLSLRHHTG